MSVKGIDSLGKVADRVFGTVVKGSQMAAAGTAGLLGASTMLGMGFESQMSTVQAISQASGSDMQRLTALAKKMGETTQFTAEEAGQD
ncbi:MAG: phage tail tape measure protein [Enterocloster sp.]